MQAADARDALAKAVYGRLFWWVVAKVNRQLNKGDAHHSFIGVLDIFGFEHFERNSYEQLCINYANETLQQQFNQYIFKLEQEEYVREAIAWDNIAFPDNQDCLDLIEARKPVPGLISLIDEQCLMPRGNDEALARRFVEAFGRHARFHADPRQRARSVFVLRHYAGDVVYDTAGFCEKNRDQIHAEAIDLVAGSRDRCVGEFVRASGVDESTEDAVAAAARSCP